MHDDAGSKRAMTPELIRHTRKSRGSNHDPNCTPSYCVRTVERSLILETWPVEASDFILLGGLQC